MRSNLGVSSFLAALCLLAITASCTVRTKTANNTNVGDVSSEDHRANLDGLLPDSDGQDTGKDTDVMAPPDSVDDMTPACLSDAECDDLNPCTDDKCDPKVGCQHTNNQAEC